MKFVSILAMGFGAALTLPALLLSVIAFSDACDRCPGNQCSDAVGSGMIGAFASIIGLMLAAAGWHCLRRAAKAALRDGA